MSFIPRSYQAQAVAAVMSRYRSGARQLMLRLPTGAGKTVVAALIIEELLRLLAGKRILFLSHRKEIIEQTADKISHHTPGVRVTIDQAEKRADHRARVVIASIQTIQSRLDHYDPETFGAVIIDECHHAFAKTWMNVIGYFGREKDALLLGLTATSKRSDGRCVSSLFQETAFEISLGELQEAGHLVPLSYFTVEASLGLGRIGLDNEGDFPVSFLGRIMNTPEVISLTLRAWREQSPRKKTIAFCASVDHAETLAHAFREIGITAACVSGQSVDRDQSIEGFRTGKIQVLTNFGVLTEGFDEPSIECVLLCRPTTSPLVYTQCLGRGLRTFPGKRSCTVIDIIDRQSHALQYNAFEAAGLKRSWKSPGKDPMREASAIAKIRVTDPVAFMKIKNALSMDETQSILMGLDPKTVLAGIDGQPVLHYKVSEHVLSADDALAEARRLMSKAGITGLKIYQTANEFKIYVDEDERAKFSTYLSWHIERATGWRLHIEYTVKPVQLMDDFMLMRQELSQHKLGQKKRQGASVRREPVRQGASSSHADNSLGNRDSSIQSLMLALKDELQLIAPKGA